MFRALRGNVLFGDPLFETSLTAAETTSPQEEDMYGDSLSGPFDLSRLPPRIYTGLCKSSMAIRGDVFNLLKMRYVPCCYTNCGFVLG